MRPSILLFPLILTFVYCQTDHADTMVEHTQTSQEQAKMQSNQSSVEIDINTNSICTDLQKECLCDTGIYKSIPSWITNNVFIVADDDPCNKYSKICCSDERNETTEEQRKCFSMNTTLIRESPDAPAEGAKNFSETIIGEFPWVVGIHGEYAHAPAIYTLVCGGSLIHLSVVLTTASCLHRNTKDFLKIRVGDWATQIIREHLPHQDRRVVEILAHPQYKFGKFTNDIALLILDKPIELNENVKTICLPQAYTQFDQARCITTAWEKNRKGYRVDVILKKIDFSIDSKDQCITTLQSFDWRFDLHRLAFCKGNKPSRDTCNPCTMLPLVCASAKTSENYQQVGVVGWGSGCGRPYPGVYYTALEFRSWIDDELVRKNINLERCE